MTTRTPDKQFARDSLYNLLQQAWGLVISFLTAIFLARGLGIEDRGVYALMIATAAIIMMILNAGLESALIYHIAPEAYKCQAIRDGLTISLITAVAASGICLVLVFGLRDVWFAEIAPSMLWLCVGLVPLILIASNLLVILRALQDFRASNLVEAVSQLVVFVLTLVLVFGLRQGVGVAIGIVMLRYLVSMVLSLWVIYRHMGQYKFLYPRFSWSSWKSYVSYGRRAYTYNLITFLNFRIDVLLLNALSVSTATIGLYDLAVNLGERLWIVSRSFSLVVLSRTAAQRGDGAQHQITPVTARYVLWAGMGLGAGLILIADPVVRFLFGAEFAGSATAVQLLLPGIIFFGMGYVLASDLTGQGKPQVLIWQSALATGVNILANLLFIPLFTYLGSALASTLSYALLTLMIVYTYCRITHTPWQLVIWPQPEDRVRLVSLIQSLRNSSSPPGW